MSFLEKHLDLITIGDSTIDAFIRLKEAHINCTLNNKNCEICLKFSEKVPYEFTEEIFATGNACNAAICASKLGLKTAVMTNIGDDYWGKKSLETLVKNKIVTRYIKINKGEKTNYHYVLWYGSERTILTHHENYKYTFKAPKSPKWIYLTSMGYGTEKYMEDIENWLKENPEIKLAFQPGTFQIRMGSQKLNYLYQRSEVFACNVSEACKITGLNNASPATLLSEISKLGPKIILITDAQRGAYIKYNNKSFFMPPYPDPKPAYERTGAGDAFTSTFISMIALGKTPEEALVYAPINSMSVVQFAGAQKGLLNKTQIEGYIMNSPIEYSPREI